MGILLAFALFLLVPRAQGADVFKWVKKEILDKIQVTGRRTFGYHHHDVEGDRNAFNLLNYQGEGGKQFTDIGYMTIAGNHVLGSISFQTQVDTNRFRDPQSQRFSLVYDKKPFMVSLGDVHGTLLNTNRFASFSKLLKGVVGGVDRGPLKLRALYSAARGSARTINIQGNNSAGPYYLSFGQIVQGSETVLVDGIEMKPMNDYTINYPFGSITFVNRIIAPTSTITISFEALNNRIGSGTIRGASASYDLGQVGRLGLTAIEQKTGSNGALSTREDLFQGGGPASTPYPLEFEPLTTFPIIVRVDGVLQIESVDYYFDQQNPSILFFTRFIPNTSTISVVYTPKPTQTLDGNRRVWGFDYRIPIGTRLSGGYVGYSQATGKLQSVVNPLEGTARGVEAGYNFRGWSATAAIRNIPDGYVSVETRGFNRNEKAVNMGLSYRGKGPWTLDLKQFNSAIAIRNVDANGDINFRRGHTTNFDASTSYNRIVGEPWTLDYQRLRSQSVNGESKTDSVQLGTSKTFGRLITHYGFESTFAEGPVGIGQTPEIKKINLESLRTRATYTAGAAWAFSVDSSISAIKAGSDSGTGNDIAASATYDPSEKLQLSATYKVSNSGKLATLGGFQNGFGLGYGGNGFSGGYVGSPFSLGATDVRLFQLAASARINPKLNVQGSMFTSHSAGSITSNTDTIGFSGSAFVSLGNGHELQFAATKSATKFVGNGAKSDALTLDAQFAGSPKGPWSYRFGANGLMSGGGSQFQQNGISFDADLTYKLTKRQHLVFDWFNSRTVGYAGQSEFRSGVSYQYQIWKSLALVGSYRVRDVRNLDSGSTGGAYRSRGFDIELSFGFGG